MRYRVSRINRRWVAIDTENKDAVVGGPDSENKIGHLVKKLNKRNDEDGLSKDDWELEKARNESEVYQYQKAGLEPFAVDNGIIYFKRQVK